MNTLNQHIPFAKLADLAEDRIDQERATFMAHPMFAPTGFGVAPTPWEAVQRAAWAAITRT